MKKILFDTNVLLDLFLVREEFYDAASRLVSAVYDGKIYGMVTSQTYADLHYVLRKEFGNEKALSCLITVFTNFVSVPINSFILQSALYAKWTDFEDAIQYFAAESNAADFIVSRDKSGYKKAQNILIGSPNEVLQFLKHL